MDFEDLELVKQAKQGNIAAFEQLFNRYQKRIFNFILRMLQNREDSAELTQDTFVKAYRSLAKLKSDVAFSSWLHQIAINLVRDKLRKHKLKTDSIDAPEETEDGTVYSIDIPDVTANPREVTVKSELQVRIKNAIASLPAQYREVIILYHIEDIDIPEISRILKIPNGTIKSRLSRAREMLKSKLSKYVITQ